MIYLLDYELLCDSIILKIDLTPIDEINFIEKYNSLIKYLY